MSDIKNLTVCTWNIACCSSLVDDINTHVQNIINRINNMNNIDVFCLQEAFGSWYIDNHLSNNKGCNMFSICCSNIFSICNNTYIDIKDKIIEGCKKKYNYSFKSKKITKLNSSYCNMKNDIYDSGLLILSKFPITNEYEYVFKETFDLSQKSFLQCKIKNIELITTHLIPSNYNEVLTKKCRHQQIDDIKEYLEKNVCDKLLLCGDLNIDYNKDIDTYNKLINELNLIDCNTYDVIKSTFIGFAKSNSDKCILDYILHKNYNIENFTIMDNETTSDHVPVKVTIKL